MNSKLINIAKVVSFDSTALVLKMIPTDYAKDNKVRSAIIKNDRGGVYNDNILLNIGELVNGPSPASEVLVIINERCNGGILISRSIQRNIEYGNQFVSKNPAYSIEFKSGITFNIAGYTFTKTPIAIEKETVLHGLYSANFSKEGLEF